MSLDFKKLPYKDTAVSVGRSRTDIENLLKDLGAEQVQWSESFVPPMMSLRVKFPQYIARFELPVDDNEKHKKQVHRAYYWYFHGLAKYVRFGLITLSDVFLPYTEVNVNGQIDTVRNLLSPEKINREYLLGEG